MKMLKTTLPYHILLGVLQHSNLPVAQQAKNSQPWKGQQLSIFKMTKTMNRKKKIHNMCNIICRFFFKSNFISHVYLFTLSRMDVLLFKHFWLDAWNSSNVNASQEVFKKNQAISFFLKEIFFIRIVSLYAKDYCNNCYLLQRRFLYKLFILCSNELIILRPSLTLHSRCKLHIPTGKKSYKSLLMNSMNLFKSMWQESPVNTFINDWEETVSDI